MRVLILCGGLGTRMREETEFKPKPLVEIGGRPILWHIMKGYAEAGYRDFVLLLGYKGELIKRYFLDYHLITNDLTVSLNKPGEVVIHANAAELDWNITLVDTGPLTMTGARIARAARHIEGERFFLTYGDGVSDLDLRALEQHHKAHGKLATVTGVHAPARFGDLTVDPENARVTGFAEKQRASGGYINGGFFLFERGVLDYLSTKESCALEGEPLERLAAAGQLQMYAHDGFWQCMDTPRDVNHLNELWAAGNPPWRTWEGQ